MFTIKTRNPGGRVHSKVLSASEEERRSLLHFSPQEDIKMSDPAPAPAAAAPPAKAKPAAKPQKARMPSIPATHPTYKDMIGQAIVALKEHGGSSRQAILKYIKANFKGVDGAEHHLKAALKRGVENKTLVQVKGVGASGSFRLNKDAPRRLQRRNQPSLLPRQWQRKLLLPSRPQRNQLQRLQLEFFLKIILVHFLSVLQTYPAAYLSAFNSEEVRGDGAARFSNHRKGYLHPPPKYSVRDVLVEYGYSFT